MEKRPSLYPWLDFYWKAFVTLSSRRGYLSTGMEVIPASISFENICLYAEKFREYNQEDFEVFLEYIMHLDDVYLRKNREKADQRREEQAKTSSQAAPPKRQR